MKDWEGAQLQQQIQIDYGDIPHNKTSCSAIKLREFFIEVGPSSADGRWRVIVFASLVGFFLLSLLLLVSLSQTASFPHFCHYNSLPPSC